MRRIFLVIITIIIFLCVGSCYCLADDRYPVALGISALSEPLSPPSRDSIWSDGQGSRVYFGSYPHTSDGSFLPIAWKVLETNDEGKLLLWSDKALEWLEYAAPGSTSNSWKESLVRQWLNTSFIERSFSIEELSIICSSYKPSGKDLSTMESPELSGELVFLPSWEELNMPSHGFYKDNSMLYSNFTRTVAPTEYAYANLPFDSDSVDSLYYNNSSAVTLWTRSPSETGVTVVGGGNYSGWFGRRAPEEKLGIAPAIRLNSDCIAFITNTEYKKGAPLEKLIPCADTGTYSITIYGHSGFSASLTGNQFVKPGEQVQVSISSVPDYQYTQISAMLIDRAGNVAAYGKIADIAESSTIFLTVPKDVLPGAYHLRLFAEKINSANLPYMVDIASNYEESTLIVYNTIFQLPCSLRTLEKEVFASTPVDCVILSPELVYIAEDVFSDCSMLRTIVFSAPSLQTGDFQFINSEIISIVAPSGENIEAYAFEKGIPFFEQ